MTTLPNDTNNTLSNDELSSMRREFHFPAEIKLRIPSPDENPSCRKPGEIVFHSVAFECGLRLPIHPFIRTVLAHFGLAPSQLGPNVWRQMIGAIILWRICSEDQDHITLDEFLYCYRFRYRNKTGHWYLFSRESRTLVLDCPNYSAKPWQNSFFFASGEGWEFSPNEGTLVPVPPVPKEWGFVAKEKLEEPILSGLYKSRVSRALGFDPICRSYRNLITQENINKYLLYNAVISSSPSLPRDASLGLNPAIFPESVGWRRGRKRKMCNVEQDRTLANFRSMKELCSDAKGKRTKRFSKPRTFHAFSDGPRGCIKHSESSSSGTSVQIVGEEKKELIFEQATQFLTADEMKQMKELEYEQALEKGICYSAKALAMMVSLCGRLGTELEKKHVSEKQESQAALEKSQKAYRVQLATTYMLSKELEKMNVKLAETEKSVKDREKAIHAKELELRSREEEIIAKNDELRAKDGMIQALQDVAVNAEKQFESLMAQYFQQGIDASYAEWSSIEPVGREQNQQVQFQSSEQRDCGITESKGVLKS